MATEAIEERERTGEHSHAHQHYGGLVEHHPDQPHWAADYPAVSHSHKHSHSPEDAHE